MTEAEQQLPAFLDGMTWSLVNNSEIQWKEIQINDEDLERGKVKLSVALNLKQASEIILQRRSLARPTGAPCYVAAKGR